MKYYLTDSIFIENEKMYSKKKNSFKKINRNNWHHILKEYGWSKIPLPWIKQLNKLSSSVLKNCGYGVLDCESDGNCFFQCIANALNENKPWEPIIGVFKSLILQEFVRTQSIPTNTMEPIYQKVRPKD